MIIFCSAVVRSCKFYKSQSWMTEGIVLNRGWPSVSACPYQTSLQHLQHLPMPASLASCKLCSAEHSCAQIVLAGLLYEEMQWRRQKVCISPKSNRTARTREAVSSPSFKNDRNKLGSSGSSFLVPLPYPKSLSSSSQISYPPHPSTSDKPMIRSVI